MASVTVTLFGSAFAREGDPRYTEARRLGTLIGARGWLLCNGGYAGTMEASARGANEAGGQTLGILCRPFGTASNRWIDRTVLCETLTERLDRLVREADACIVLAGGTGTLLELAAVWELQNKGFAATRPIVALGNFWRPVVKLVSDELRSEGRGKAADAVFLAANPEEAVAYIDATLTRGNTHAPR